jgi:excisionase family DNA binding protein
MPRQKMSNLEPLLSKRDAAAIGGVTVRTIERIIARGELRILRFGRRIRIAPSELARYIADAL